MDPLASELLGCGALDEAAVAWATAHRHDRGISLDSALLELELVDEDALVNALGACFHMKAARHEDLPSRDPELGRRLPVGFSRSFGLCPVRLATTELTVMVNGPLPRESIQELSELFGFTTRQLVAPEHYIALGLANVYGTEPSERTLALETRLGVHRTADVRRPLAAIDGAGSFSQAAHEVLGYAANLFEHTCFVACGADALRVLASTGSSDPKRGLPLPRSTCTLGPALRHGGFFLGGVAGNDADRAFFDALGRPLPRAAVVAPIAASPNASLVLLADNGPRGIARRWAAELTLLGARLGQRRTRDTAPQPAATHVPAPESPEAGAAVPASESAPTAERAVERLTAAARAEGLSLEAFVDRLLEEHAARARTDVSATLAGEVKGLFERLATDIPAHLARGMEAAFRDLVPRIAPAPVPAPSPGAPPAAPRTGAAAVDIEVVSVEQKPKEVPSYQSARRKAPRVKL